MSLYIGKISLVPLKYVEISRIPLYILDYSKYIFLTFVIIANLPVELDKISPSFHFG